MADFHWHTSLQLQNCWSNMAAQAKKWCIIMEPIQLVEFIVMARNFHVLFVSFHCHYFCVHCLFVLADSHVNMAGHVQEVTLLWHESAQGVSCRKSLLGCG